MIRCGPAPGSFAPDIKNAFGKPNGISKLRDYALIGIEEIR